jgi:hypothetical protein
MIGPYMADAGFPLIGSSLSMRVWRPEFLEMWRVLQQPKLKARLAQLMLDSPAADNIVKLGAEGTVKMLAPVAEMNQWCDITALARLTT